MAPATEEGQQEGIPGSRRNCAGGGEEEQGSGSCTSSSTSLGISVPPILMHLVIMFASPSYLNGGA
eukprot:4340105-Pyramimonas_sp.AAC.1